MCVFLDYQLVGHCRFKAIVIQWWHVYNVIALHQGVQLYKKDDIYEFVSQKGSIEVITQMTVPNLVGQS